jgi:hypothetical protein
MCYFLFLHFMLKKLSKMMYEVQPQAIVFLVLNSYVNIFLVLNSHVHGEISGIEFLC